LGEYRTKRLVLEAWERLVNGRGGALNPPRYMDFHPDVLVGAGSEPAPTIYNHNAPMPPTPWWMVRCGCRTQIVGARCHVPLPDFDDRT